MQYCGNLEKLISDDRFLVRLTGKNIKKLNNRGVYPWTLHSVHFVFTQIINVQFKGYIVMGQHLFNCFVPPRI